MIGTSDGQAYEDELDMHLNRPYEPKQPQTPAARIESGFDALDKDQMDKLIKQFNEQNAPDPSIVNPGEPAPGYFNTGRDVRISSNWKGEGSDMEGHHPPLDDDQVFIDDLKQLPKDWKEILSDPDKRAPGYRVRIPKPALTS